MKATIHQAKTVYLLSQTWVNYSCPTRWIMLFFCCCLMMHLLEIDTPELRHIYTHECLKYKFYFTNEFAI